jgi:deoxyribodipyrimidine photo-lyase
MKPTIAAFWFRRDLRLYDNAGLYHALKSGHQVLPLFIFDTDILDQLDDKRDSRVYFIHQALSLLKNKLQALGSNLQVMHGKPIEVWKALLATFDIKEVYTNHDYEPYAISRDEAIRDYLFSQNVSLQTFKDQVIFEKNEVLKDDGTPYVVWTPYSKKWKERLNDFYLKSYPMDDYSRNFLSLPAAPMPSLTEIGFEATNDNFPTPVLNDELIRNYQNTRDFPAIDGTSRLSVHLRFGTVSIREITRQAKFLNEKFLNELIWREFYQMILWHFPHVTRQSFRKEYDGIEWRNDEGEFELWCKGETGYPIVDAGMRELNATGFMHNRLRMITASFLTKDLLIDWRWGEAYFAKKLIDFELASNNGGWQWAAGTGVDAAPYFRIFNPSSQAGKFDPAGVYIRKWVKEIDELTYPLPIVDHQLARERVLNAYKNALNR